MKKTIIAIAAITILCSAAELRRYIGIRQMVTYIHATYPQADLQDIYKTSFQDYWGAEHLAPDSAIAARYLRAELDGCADANMQMPLFEPCGWRHHYTRASLQNIQEGKMSERQLLQRFLSAATDAPILPIRQTWAWRYEWALTEKIALHEVPEWHNEELQAALTDAAEQCAAVRHSEAFRSAYQPHYRIVRNQ